MRVLLLASWHHFAFLVISVCLLGFGASGTALSFFRSWLLPRSETAMFALVVATAASMPFSIHIAQHIPVEARFVPTLLGRQIGLWLLYWTVLFIPFFLGASAIGLSLMAARTRLPTIYAANLFGSAMGAFLAAWVMHWVPPAWLGALMGGVTLTALFRWTHFSAPARSTGPSTSSWRRFPLRLGTVTVLVAAVALLFQMDPPTIRVDPFKYKSYIDRLEDDHRATRVAGAHGPRAVIDVYAGDAFHEMAFLSIGDVPPPMLAITMDGHWAGSILRIGKAEDARAVDNTLMSVSYSFVRERPRALLLGETGGTNVWLAERHRAESIHVVQPNAELIALVEGPLRNDGGHVFALPAVHVVADEPRHYVEHTNERFDLVQIVGLESWAVATGGVGGLKQDNLVTVEGLEACLETLAPNGILSVCRAIQTPPRDNLKLIATLIDALERLGIDHPNRHTVVLRDYLAVCTMVKAAPWTPEEIRNVRAVCARRELTPVYFTGIRDDELNHPDRLPGPPGQNGSWLHHALTRLFSTDSKQLIDDWPFDIRPPTDDRPFFANFGKLGSTRMLMETFGDLWLTRTDMAFFFVLAAIGIIAIAGVLLTVLPLRLVGGIRRSPGISSTAVYFTAIGLAYLIVEITMLSRLIHLIGDPVRAGAITIAGFLFFSGLGSLTSQALAIPRAKTVRLLFAALIAVGLLEPWLMNTVMLQAGSFGLEWRLATAVLAIGPLGFLMGFPMPTGLGRLERDTPALVPWAWGVNGFASVLAPPLATAIGMTHGFKTAGILALVLYAIAALVFDRLPRRA